MRKGNASIRGRFQRKNDYTNQKPIIINNPDYQDIQTSQIKFTPELTLIQRA